MPHQNPEDFHEARKSPRSTLNAINSAERTVPVGTQAVEQGHHSYGKAQEARITEAWLKQEGFLEQAGLLAERQRMLQQDALEQAGGLSLDSLSPLRAG